MHHGRRGHACSYIAPICHVQETLLPRLSGKVSSCLGVRCQLQTHRACSGRLKAREVIKLLHVLPDEGLILARRMARSSVQLPADTHTRG
jgi:hypothetical protein